MSSSPGTRPPASPAEAPAVEVAGARKGFGRGGQRVRAVDGVDLRVGRGEVVALLGPNGAGKTTLLDMVLGFTDPDEGTVRTLGAAPRRSVRAGRIGAVLQTGGLLDDLSVRETVAMVATLHRDPLPVDEALERAGAAGFARRKVSQCSGGQQQRLRFALALLPEPDLLVLDEPTAGMDVRARREFWAAMHAEAERGRTVVFATHYLDEAEEFAVRTVVLKDGRVVADAATAEVRALAGTRVVSFRWTGPGPVVVPGASPLDPAGGRVRLTGPDTDAIARHLLATPHARELEIAHAGLEEAFLGLTADRPHPPTSRPEQGAP
ncbi:ABC transporter ATP-binding protein [Kocuria flava]|uniref:ABC transporter ATP-binding protein n=1 Tax=Kocuria flava TaxID=446860 RepID=UPI001FF267E1|nr:ABC transporter ATP-binding protein [Kocuria flava]MCJ8503907.1 ABC transporter ATP-binding protein [Kocuria flava]